MGCGVLSSMCMEQKLNTKSSTEAELVGVAEYLPKVSYLRFFMESQGFKMTRNIALQGDQSETLTEVNGRAFCSKTSRHLNIR